MKEMESMKGRQFSGRSLDATVKSKCDISPNRHCL
jgi:hypothetical protein